MPVTERQHSGDFNVALNGYRGVCALLVYFYHLGSAGVVAWPAGSPANDAATYLWSSLRYGVEMFFMISGFVIIGSLLRHGSVGGFLRDRAIRIFTAWIPALLAVTAVCVAFRMKVFADVTALEGTWIFIANLLLLPPLAPLPMIHFASWSLTYEWVFYFTAALGALAYRRAPRRWWAPAVWVVPAAIFVCLFPRALFFITGVLVFKYRGGFAAHARWLKFPVLSLLVFLVAWRATGVDKAQLSATMVDYAVDGRIFYLAIAFLASVHLFASVCTSASKQFAFLNGRVFQFLGNVSYSFYLWHALVMALVKRVIAVYITPVYGTEVAFAVFAVACLVVALPLSWASWKVFEVSLAKVLRRRTAAKPLAERVAHAA
jgi:peptidoglycan/LPS O-acetylase OafA/YrhL